MEQQFLLTKGSSISWYGGTGTYVRVEEEAGVGEALDGGGAGAGVGRPREEGLELVAVQYDGQAAGGAAGEQHLVCGGHPDGEEVPDRGVPDALPAEVKLILLQLAVSCQVNRSFRLTKSICYSHN
jgi:hypothetical protein